MKRLFKTILVASLFSTSLISAGIATLKIKPKDSNILEAKLHVDVPDKEFLYKKYINLSVDQPNITISNQTTSQEAESEYDHATKKDVWAYKKPFDINVTIEKDKNYKATSNPNLQFSYYLSSAKQAQDEFFQFNFPKTTNEKIVIQKNESSVKSTSPSTSTTTATTTDKSNDSTENKIEKKESKLSDTISNLLEKTNSLWLRLLLAFLLGLLLSLTPCIYPMIPITVGILQSQGSKSIWRNFFVSSGYTLGLAITFASFGLAAALGGAHFGRLLVNPVFVIILVAFLVYMALSMFDLYEIYIPKFLRPKNTAVKKGSFLAALVLGVMMGTMASPCLSPGLVLLLSIVAILKSWILGFILLFCFGIGASFPLLIVGTFSSSINIMPRSGGWMMEIKKIFGFLLFGMCFYYLKNIVPINILMWIISAFVGIAGIYYFASIKQSDTPLWRKIKNILGFGLIILSVILFTHTYKSIYYPEIAQQKSFWHSDYQEALEKAKKENKNLFIDIWAVYCAICISINNTLMQEDDVAEILQNKVVSLKVDGTNRDQEPYATVEQKYKEPNVPTFLLIDPKTETVIKKWHNITKEDILNDVK